MRGTGGREKRLKPMGECGMTSCVEPSRDNDVMRGTGGREKRLKPTRGRKFIASNPRKARGIGAPRGRRVGISRKIGSNTTTLKALILCFSFMTK